MIRLATKQTWAVWLATVLVVWIAVAAGGTIEDRDTFGGHFPISGFLPHAATFAFWLCIVACGLPTAVALWLRQWRSRVQSVLGGLATALLTFALLYLHAGTASIPAIPSMVVVIAVEFPIAFALRGVSLRRSARLPG